MLPKNWVINRELTYVEKEQLLILLEAANFIPHWTIRKDNPRFRYICTSGSGKTITRCSVFHKMDTPLDYEYVKEALVTIIKHNESIKKNVEALQYTIIDRKGDIVVDP